MYNSAPITVTTRRGGGRSKRASSNNRFLDSAKWQFSKVIGIQQPERKLRRTLFLI
jgi:hypothetical protein